MAEEAQYESHKRKYEESTSPPPPPRRPTGFSAPIIPSKSLDSDAPPTAAAYGSVPPPMDEFQMAKQKLQELASRAFNAEGKRSKAENGGGFAHSANVSSDQKFMASNIHSGSTASIPVSHGYSGSKKIEIPNGRVGVIIGKAGETIKYLQIQSGARIQVTRDADHELNSANRTVELMGNPDQIAKAEQLINDVLSEASVGGPGTVSRRMTGTEGSEQFIMRVANNKVGLVIGKGGETIKNIQTSTGARVQVIPLHPPPGDTSADRTVQIEGTSEQIEAAKQMVHEVTESRNRNPTYAQQGYQAQPPTNWTPQPPQAQQPGGYGYMQQPGAYPGAQSQYGMSQPPYSGYPQQQTTGGYPQNWSQSSDPQSQQSQGTGYDYYSQQPPPQHQQPAGAPPTDNTGYNYSQQPTSGGYGQQGYSQDGYGGGYQAPPAQQQYGQPPANPSSGYDQQHGYGTTTGYGNVTNPPQEGQPPAYNAQGETGHVPAQQGYTRQPSPNPPYPTQGTNQPGYGMPPTSQAGYGVPSSQGGYGPTQGYGPPQGQKAPTNAPSYGQPQQSPSQGYGYPPAQSGYGQADPGAPRAAPAASTYGGAATQPGAYSSYGAPAMTPPSYGGQPPAYYSGAYSQPSAYPADGAAPPPASQPPAQPSPASKTSPKS